jgi:DNA-binding transcriptional LysR family regulator
VDLRQLRALRAVARAGTFHAAAAELGYTQSAISQQIASLERTVGQRLVDRPEGRSPAGLTPTGRVLLEHAEAVFARLEAAAREIDDLRNGQAGVARVGYFTSAGTRIVPATLELLRKRSPQLRVQLDERACDGDLQRGVIVGDLDVALVVMPLAEPSLACTELLAEPYVAMVRRDDALAGRPSLGSEDLRGRPLAAVAGCQHQEEVDDRLAELELESAVAYRSPDNDALVTLAATGTACAIVPRSLAAGVEGRGVVALPVDELELPRRRIGLALHAGRTPPAAATVFADGARDACRALAAETAAA